MYPGVLRLQHRGVSKYRARKKGAGNWQIWRCRPPWDARPATLPPPAAEAAAGGGPHLDQVTLLRVIPSLFMRCRKVPGFKPSCVFRRW